MSSCGKAVKNPCMVCRRTVTPKSGLQCQGSCKAWIHFTCCSYTPGKIKDIKAKLIKVRCPCPHCTPDVPKEEIVQDDVNFSCLNTKCPMNMPRCGTSECPENKMNQMPSAAEWPGISCGPACKRNKSDASNMNMNINCKYGDERPSQMSSYPGRQTSANCRGQYGSQSCGPPPPAQGYVNSSTCSSSPSPDMFMDHPPLQCPPPPRPPPSCVPPPCPAASPFKAPPPLQSPPTCPSPPPFQTPPPNPQQVMPSISVVENMCETVGLLSDQLNQLMAKMTHVLNPCPKTKGTSKGGASGNSCLCPQNPRRPF